MSNAIYQIPTAQNEPVLSYAPNSPERLALEEQLQKLKGEFWEIPMTIGGQKITTRNSTRAAILRQKGINKELVIMTGQIKV